ncbi:unnamed protein product [Peronospora belbahrii]|uniref:50S ribosomal protein L13 n=1 Tax=Peronospora belbahrii TaxID=622444 RepID=A0ABN8CW96_9STRA|nr:unnamed protein product [Peronospora belbahrii]
MDGLNRNTILKAVSDVSRHSWHPFCVANTSLRNKWNKKLYRWHTGHPGGLKQRTAKEQFERKPEEVLRKAVFGMLPRNRMRALQDKKLKIFMGETHEFVGQVGENPVIL